LEAIALGFGGERIQQIVDAEFEQIELEDWDDIDPTAPASRGS